jgi:hypothetical protein
VSVEDRAGGSVGAESPMEVVAPASVPAVLAPTLSSAVAARAAAAPEGRAAAAPQVRAAALERVRSAAGQLVPRLQYWIAQLGPGGQTGLAALTASVAVAFGALIPAYHTIQTLSADLARAQHPTASANLEQAAPHLVATLPTRAQIPAVVGQVFAAASAAGVPLDAGRYAFTPAKSGAIARYDLEFPVKAAPYPQIRAFINGTLAAVPAASLEKLHIERKAIGDQMVSADIGFVVWVRSGDSP